jgi:hypothetical protein
MSTTIRTYPRFTTTYKLSGTKTFRLSSVKTIASKKKEPLHGNWGGNIQNKDKHIRDYFCADGVTDSIYLDKNNTELQFNTNIELYSKCIKFLQTLEVSVFNLDDLRKIKLLFQIDQAGAEALIVAYLCNVNSTFRKLFLNNIKPHTFCAMNIFYKKWESIGFNIKELQTLKIEDLRVHPEFIKLSKIIKDSDNEPMRYYYLGKKTIHGSDYDMKGDTMSTAILEETDGAVNISPMECDNLLRIHHNTCPEIKRDFHNGVINMASKNNRYLFNLFGFPYEFTGHWDDTLFRLMYAFIPQSTVGSITNIAITEIQREIMLKLINSDFGLDLLQNGHDSILGQSFIPYWKDVALYVTPHIERELINFNGEKFKMKSEYQIGFNWKPSTMYYNKDTREWVLGDNPLGLREVKL